MRKPKALVLTGYGLNCDYETDFALKLAGADSKRVHINELIKGETIGNVERLDAYHILAFDGGFSWADDHGAGVILSTRLKYNIGEQLEQFIHDGKLIIGICNGFQALVNLGLLPGFNQQYDKREAALITNDQGNFRDDWVYIRANPKSQCVFTKGIDIMELPIRHAEGKFYASPSVIEKLFDTNQVVFQYVTPDGELANNRFPYNPNGSLRDIAGICDSTGRIFGLMPHPEAYNHFTNHPNWTYRKIAAKRHGGTIKFEGDGIRIFSNAVEYINANF